MSYDLHIHSYVWVSIGFRYYPCSLYSPLGHYWIDPNEGSNKDAIQVYCQGPETCVAPQPSTTASDVCWITLLLQAL